MTPVIARHVQRIDDVAQAEHRKEIAQPVLCQPGADHDQEIARMALQRFEGRRLERRPLGADFGEDRRFGDLGADIDTEPEQQQRGEERDAPAPREQLILRHQGDEIEDTGGEQIADRHAHRREASVEAAPARRREFDGHDHRTAILGARAKSL
jgi:hypothetical protein